MLEAYTKCSFTMKAGCVDTGRNDVNGSATIRAINLLTIK
jgi:hypothetical protein